MKQGISYLGKYILLLLFLLCFGYVLALNTVISDSDMPVIYDTDDTSLSLESVKSMREETDFGETLSWTAVQTLDNQNFSNETLNRDATGTLLLLNGSSSSLVSSTTELMADDLTGCILSTEAAWELFGETEVSGGEIICNHISYEVRGVYEDSEPVVLLPAETWYTGESRTESSEEDGNSGLTDGGSIAENADAEEAGFDKIIVTPNAELTDAQRSEAIKTFETIYAVGKDKTDCMVYRRLAGVFALLIPVIVLIFILLSGVVSLVKMRRKIVRFGIGCLLLTAVTALFFILFQMRPSIPADLIPNTWSDFDFWKDKLTDFIANMQHVLFSDKNEIELKLLKPLVRMSAFTGIGLILFVLTLLAFRIEERNKQVSHGIVRREDKETVRKRTECEIAEIKNSGKGTKTAIAELHGLMIRMICTCIVEFIAIFLLHRWEISPENVRVLIYLWPYFLVSRYVMKLACSQ